MPRQARIVIPNTPHHIVQRGHNRKTVFVSEDDYLYYCHNLTDFKKQFGCRVYAYCLMTNHVHLVVDPGEDVESIALLMKRVAGRQTRYVNRLEKRTGSLWEGRYKSSPISSKEYLLACCRYIELNPLRAGIVSTPADYKWSSYRCKAEGKTDDLVDFDGNYLAFGRNERERAILYKDYVHDTIPDSEWKLIREAVQRGQLTGSSCFRDELTERLGMRLSNQE
ncbi:MAG: transposase [Proteobacteria bacterium]|nr:transposase [Pseudomonadota bacterium]